MQILKLLKQSLIMFFFASMFLSSSVFAETSDTPNIWSGVYQGFVPCPDCKGVKTSLALNKNNSYILMTQYIGRSNREFVEKGKFTLDADSKVITLTPRKGGANHYYLVGENTLTQLDDKGSPITGDEAARYILRKSSMSDNAAPSSHSGH